MNCDEIRALIGPAVDNELPNVELARVNDHLASCQACQIEWEKILELKGAISDIARGNEMSDAFEKKILFALKQEERQARGRHTWALVGLAAAATFLLFFMGRPESQSPQIAVKDAVSAESLVAGLGHHSELPEDKSFSVDFVRTTDLAEISGLAGFTVQGSKLASFDVSGADVVKSSRGKTLVRLCYTSVDSKYSTCIDCYQAPQGTIAFGGGTVETINGKTVRINSVGKQSFLMMSHNGLDVVYSGAMPEDQLLALVKPNV